ncbi:MAG: UTRA domain-containing protein [Novosphingobium sp.]
MKPAPLHERIRREIEARILSGAWAPGARVPGEVELMAQYHCARMTVNKALSALAQSGLVERRRRAGTFVARPRSQSMVLEITDLAREVAARGQTYTWTMTRRRELSPGRSDMAGPVLEVEGVHCADGHSLAFEHRLVSIEQVPEILNADLAAEAPGTWLLGHVPWTEAENRIGASAANSALAKALGIATGDPCLTITRRTWRSGVPVTLVTQHFIAERHELVARFGSV